VVGGRCAVVRKKKKVVRWFVEWGFGERLVEKRVGEGGVVVHGASALKRRVKKQLKNGVSDKPVRVRLLTKRLVVAGRRRVERKARSSSLECWRRSWTLSAAGPCAPRGHVPPGHEAASGPPGKSFYFYFFFTGFLCECVCVRPCLVK